MTNPVSEAAKKAAEEVFRTDAYLAHCKDIGAAIPLESAASIIQSAIDSEVQALREALSTIAHSARAGLDGNADTSLDFICDLAGALLADSPSPRKWTVEDVKKLVLALGGMIAAFDDGEAYSIVASDRKALFEAQAALQPFKETSNETQN